MSKRRWHRRGPQDRSAHVRLLLVGVIILRITAWLADGGAVLDAAGKLGKIVVGMNRALGGTPVTVKLRTGVKDGKNNAHKIMPRLATEWGAAALTVRRILSERLAEF